MDVKFISYGLELRNFDGIADRLGHTWDRSEVPLVELRICGLT